MKKFKMNIREPTTPGYNVPVTNAARFHFWPFIVLYNRAEKYPANILAKKNTTTLLQHFQDEDFALTKSWDTWFNKCCFNVDQAMKYCLHVLTPWRRTRKQPLIRDFLCSQATTYQTWRQLRKIQCVTINELNIDCMCWSYDLNVVSTSWRNVDAICIVSNFLTSN